MEGNDDNRINEQWKRLSDLRIKKGSLKRTARKIETASVKHAHKFILRRWSNVKNVSRHLISWLILMTLLISLTWVQAFWFQQGYATVGPEEGGVYAEGVVGRVETLNPLYAASLPEKTVDKLVFSSLLAYDRDNHLRPDTAKAWKVSDDGKVYTVDLRDDIYWHDGQKLTVDDVIFTIKLMQSPTAKSPLYQSWAGVTVEKTSKSQIRIITPAVYAPFAHAMTFSILPKHLLEKVEPHKLREDSFSRIPVGSGPFKFQRVQIISTTTDRLVVHLEKNEKYHGGIVRLSRFQVHTFQTSESLRKGLQTGEIGAAYKLDSKDVKLIEETNPFIKNTHMRVGNGVFAIFNNSSPNLGDISIRQALTQATNRKAIINDAINQNGAPLEGPIIGQATDYQLHFDVTQASAKLDQAGWKMGASGLREKDGRKLELIVVTPKSGDYPRVVEQLAKQWKQVGVGISIKLVTKDKLFSEYVQPRAYDIFINELSIGADPDVYAYWHSSQAKPDGLNFANYKSAVADDILASARSRHDESLRESKYRLFSEQWSKDAASIALYQPEANYLTTSSAWTGEDDSVIAEPSTRLRFVYAWTALDSQVFKTP